MTTEKLQAVFNILHLDAGNVNFACALNSFKDCVFNIRLDVVNSSFFWNGRLVFFFVFFVKLVALQVREIVYGRFVNWLSGKVKVTSFVSRCREVIRDRLAGNIEVTSVFLSRRFCEIISVTLQSRVLRNFASVQLRSEPHELANGGDVFLGSRNAVQAPDGSFFRSSFRSYFVNQREQSHGYVVQPARVTHLNALTCWVVILVNTGCEELEHLLFGVKLQSH